MSNEIRTAVGLNYTNGTRNAIFSKQVYADQTTVGYADHEQEIGITEEDVTLDQVTAPRFCIIQNLDATNYVDIGTNNSGSLVNMQSIPAGKFSILWLKAGVVLRAKANAAPVKIRKIYLET